MLTPSEDFQRLLNYAYFYLKFRPRTKKEIGDYLYKKITKRHWSRDDVSRVIKQLEKEGFIDDKKFIQWLVEQRSLLKPKSQFVLKRELAQHGADKDLIDEYFSQNPLNEETLVLKTLQERWRRLAHLDKRKRFEKAASFLLRRGFSFETAKKTIEKME